MNNLFKMLLFLLISTGAFQCSAMKISGKTWTGKTEIIDVDDSSVTGDLYDLFSAKMGVPVDNIKLIFMGREVPKDGSQLLSDAGISGKRPIHIVFKSTESDSEAPAISAEQLRIAELEALVLQLQARIAELEALLAVSTVTL